MVLAPTPGKPAIRRRDLQKEQTRFDLAMAAFELAKAEGLAHVRVPQIAEAAGVSTRTFNNYFASKEAAIVWPTTLRVSRMVTDLLERPQSESIAEAVTETVAGLYAAAGQDGLPEGWLGEFRTMVASEPTLHGEFLKVTAAGERELASAIADRTRALDGDLEPLVFAAVATAAERAAVLYWFRQGSTGSLADVVRRAVAMAVGGLRPKVS
jgi:AcrR family transcriptional regulator